MRALVLLCTLAACIDPIDARWQLDHDHVIAARATPPRIRAGETTNLDALVAHDGGEVTVDDPMTAELDAASARFAQNLERDGNTWRLVAPDATVLASARPALGLPEDAPVPVDVMLTFRRSTDRADAAAFRVKKTVWLGEPRANPELPPVLVDGVPATDELVLPIGRDVYFSLEVSEGMRVNWLTSVGTLFQDDVATSFLRIAPEDRRSGELVVVMRDLEGGVAWRVWSVRAE